MHWYVCTYVHTYCLFLRSFGVLLYEIVTFGDIPYEDMGVQEIVSNAKEGMLRLPKWVPYVIVLFTANYFCVNVYIYANEENETMLGVFVAVI